MKYFLNGIECQAISPGKESKFQEDCIKNGYDHFPCPEGLISVTSKWVEKKLLKENDFKKKKKKKKMKILLLLSYLHRSSLKELSNKNFELDSYFKPCMKKKP